MRHFRWILTFLIILLVNPNAAGSTDSVFDLHGVEMVFVPGGEVQMGGTLEEGLAFCEELYANIDGVACLESSLSTLYAFTDVSTVDVRGFYMDKYEVSIENYLRCVEADVCVLWPVENEFYSLLEVPDLPIGMLPVDGINYYEAAIYCAWRQARLPTEAEWQYAAVGSNDYAFPWGDDTDDILANYCDESCFRGTYATTNDGYRERAPVDSFDEGQSWAGIYNLSGNVSEWTSTFYSSLPDTGGDVRISKGGSYQSAIFGLAVWLRTPLSTLVTFRSTGFRCVRTTDP